MYNYISFFSSICLLFLSKSPLPRTVLYYFVVMLHGMPVMSTFILHEHITHVHTSRVHTVCTLVLHTHYSTYTNVHTTYSHI